MSRIRPDPWMQVNYPNDMMVSVRKITHLEKDPANLAWLLPCSIVWQLVMALGEGGGVGASRHHRLCFSGCFGSLRAAFTF